MKKTAIILCLLMLALALNATSYFNEKEAAIGVCGGQSTGNGLSGRYYWGKSGVQATFFGLAYGSKDDYKQELFNFGINYLYRVKEYNSSRFYLMGGAAFSYTFYRDNDYYYPESEKRKLLSVGVGPGFELIPFKNYPEFRMCIELPLTYDSDKEFYSYIPSGGVYYYFK